MLYIWSSNIDSFTPVAYICITGKYFSPCRIDINLRISKICALYVNETFSKKRNIIFIIKDYGKSAVFILIIT